MKKQYKVKATDIANGYKTVLEGYIAKDGLHITKEKRTKWKPKKFYFSKISNPEKWL